MIHEEEKPEEPIEWKAAVILSGMHRVSNHAGDNEAARWQERGPGIAFHPTATFSTPHPNTHAQATHRTET